MAGLLNLGSLILVVLCLLLFIIRVILSELFLRKQHSHVDRRLIGWYSGQEVFGSTSEPVRKYMRRSNGFSTAIFSILCVVVLLAWLASKLG